MATPKPDTGAGAQAGSQRRTSPIPQLVNDLTTAPPAKKAVPAKPPGPRKAAPRKAAPASPAAVSGLAGLNRNLDAALQRLIAAAPGRITITSGLRSRAEQESLYAKYLAGSGNLAAKPGTSLHEKGSAYDLAFQDDATRAWAHANAARFGLSFPIAGESWHVQLADGKSAGGGGRPTGGGLAVDGSSVLGPDGKPDAAKAIATYGFIAELARTVPDIQRVLKQAIDGGWDTARFTAAVQGTAWWKRTNEADRQNQLLKATDPQAWRQKRQRVLDSIVIISRQLGVPQDNKKIEKIADQAMRLGWSAQELQRYVAAEINVVDGKRNTGQAAVTVDALKEQANQYLVPISTQTLQQWTRQILAGDVPQEAFIAYLKEQAKSLFPGMKAAIDSGVTPEQYTNPYRQLAAQTLEINPADVNFLDPKWASALFQTGKDGVRTSMSLADWAMELRKRPEYSRTRGAQETAARFADTLVNAFGRL